MKRKNYFLRVFTLCVFGIVATATAFSQTNIVIEAENADVFHFATTSSRSGFSNGTGIDMESTANAYVRYNVTVASEGVYNLAIAYAGMNIRSCYVQVNNQKPLLLTFTESTTDWETSDKSLNQLIYLDEGANVIELGAYEYNRTQHAPAIDKLTITDSAETFEKPTDRITPVVVEAEAWTSKTGNAETRACSDFASGSGAAAGDESANGSLTYENINVLEAGTYDLIWYYANGGQTRGVWIQVNNQQAKKSIVLANSSTWGDDHKDPADIAGENGETAHADHAPYALAKIEQVYLEAGNNSITIGGANIFERDFGPNLDRFVIKSSPKSIDKPADLKPTSNAYIADYTDIRTSAAINTFTSQENLNNLFDNDETTFFTAPETTQIEIELPYPIIATSYSLALNENYDKSNVTVEYYRLPTSWCSDCPKWVNLDDQLKDTEQPEFTAHSVSIYTTSLGTEQKDHAAQKFRITLNGENIAVGEFQINGFPYVGPYDEDTYFPLDLTEGAGAWAFDQKGWGTSDGYGSEGVHNIHDRKPVGVSSPYTAESNKCYIEFSFDTPTEVGAYSICNRPDQYDRNPKKWILYGYAENQDDNNAGTILDYQYDVVFTNNYLQNFVFKIADPAAYKRYRLHITQANGSGGNLDAGEIQLLPAYPAPADIIAFTSGELVIPVDGSKSADDYINAGLSGLVFNEGSQLTGAENLEIYGTVKIVKTFATDKWHPIGFPFDIVSINVEYGGESKPGVVYNGSGTITEGLDPADGNSATANIYAATYDGDAFVYASALEARQAYILEFPRSAFGNAETVTVTFSTAAGEVLNTTGAAPSINGYTFVANPDLTNKSDLGALYYYILNESHKRFEKATTLSTPLKPFDAVIAATEGDKVSINIDEVTVLPSIAKKHILSTEYYNLQGIKIAKPVKDQVYLIKKIFASGMVSVSKNFSY
ncbi:MAG: hypothetical protein LBP72_09325 [Dysgonamonadaceae bacterium]|jgi:hypothetical protein|nr:hypothetical protein [Dysgonamonadaceae bacterium]